MSTPPCAVSYAAVLRVPHVRSAFAAALLGRLSYGTVPLCLMVALSGTGGSYAIAGTAMAAFTLAIVVVTPARAALIDRFGARRTLPPMAACYALLLGLLAMATWRAGTPPDVLVALAAASGTCAPPLGPVMRTLWGRLLADRGLRQRAFSLDTVAEELLFVAGPLLAGGIVALASAPVGVLLSAVIVLCGTLALTASPAARTHLAAPRPQGTRESATATDARPRGGTGLWRPVLVCVGLGAGMGALELLVVAVTAESGQGAAAAWVLAALSAGSAAGGLAYGALPWRAGAAPRLAVLGTGFGVSLAAAGLAPGIWGLAAGCALAGAFVAPALTTAYLMVDESAPAHARTRANAWVNTAFNAGVPGGSAAGGLMAAGLPAEVCFGVVAGVVVGVAGAAGWGRSTRLDPSRLRAATAPADPGRSSRGPRSRGGRRTEPQEPRNPR